MIHQLDHSTNDASACVGYVHGRDSLTAHIKLVNCPKCKFWLRFKTNRARAIDLENRVTGKV
jgi:hypothetical protein